MDTVRRDVDALPDEIGLLLTVVALLPGARFWFNLLNKLRNALG